MPEEDIDAIIRKEILDQLLKEDEEAVAKKAWAIPEEAKQPAEEQNIEPEVFEPEPKLELEKPKFKTSELVNVTNEKGDLISPRPVKILDIRETDGVFYYLVEGTGTYFPETHIEAAPLEIKEEPAKALEEQLNEAREKYLKAQKELSEYSRILKLDLKGESKKKVEAELAKAEAEYKKLRAEYVGSSVDKFIEERTREIDGKMKLYQEQKGLVSRGLGKFAEKYKTLGKFNLEWGLGQVGLEKTAQFIKTKGGKVGKVALRSINARTAISWGLLGVGVGLGATSAIGWGAIITRRFLAGAGSGIGTYDLLNLGGRKIRRKALEKDAEKVKGLEVTRYLAHLESQAILEGRQIDDLKNDTLYQKLLERYQQVLEKKQPLELEIEFWEDKFKKYLEKEIETVDSQLQDELRWSKFEQKVQRLLTGLAAGVMGTMVGSGALAELLGAKTQVISEATPQGLSEVPAAEVEGVETRPTATQEPPREIATSPHPSPSPGEGGSTEPQPESAEAAVREAPEVPPVEPSKVELLHNGEGTGAYLETTKDGEVILHAGQRGIEGALLDLEETNPVQYDKLIQWLEKTYSSEVPGGKTPDKLVHRFVLDYAQKEGFTVDGGGKDLSRIFEADINLKPTGEVEVVTEKVKFIEPLEAETPGAPAVEAPETLPEPPHPDIPLTVREFDYETLSTAPRVEPPAEAAPAEVGEGVSETETKQAAAPAEPQAAESEAVRAQEILQEAQGKAETARDELTKLAGAAEEVATARLELALESGWDTSKALAYFLQKDYPDFLKGVLKVSADNLDQIQNTSLEVFLEEYERAGTRFRGRYAGLKQVIDQVLGAGEQQLDLKTIDVRQFVVTLAKKWEK